MKVVIKHRTMIFFFKKLSELPYNPITHLTVEFTSLSSPARSTGTVTIQWVARSSIPTNACGTTSQTPGATGTVDGAV